nr:hypothetical protein [Tanacetum cinerariifolium]
MTYLSLDKAPIEELTKTDVPMTDVPSQPTSSRPKHLYGVIVRMSIRQGYMMQQMRKTFIHNSNVQTILEKNTVLNVHPTSSSSSALIHDLQHQLYMRIKSDPQSSIVAFDMWNALKAKYEKSSTLIDSCRHDAFRKRDHDDHPGDDAPLEGRRGKEACTFTTQDPCKYATSFLENDLEEKLTRRILHNQAKKKRDDPKEVFPYHKIIEVVRITTDKQYGIDFLEEIIVKRDDNKPAFLRLISSI